MLLKSIAVCDGKLYGGEKSELNFQYTIYDSVRTNLGELLERMQIAQLGKKYLSPFMLIKAIAVCDGKIYDRERSEDAWLKTLETGEPIGLPHDSEPLTL